MADRRTDDRPAAPDRSSGAGTTGSSSPQGQSSLSRGQERVAAAVSKARDSGRGSRNDDTAATSATSTTGSTSPVTKAGRGSGARPAPRRVRRARLRLTHIDPWSVMKTAFLLSIAIGIVTVVAVGIVWSVLGAAGVWDSINRAVADVAGDTGGDFAIEDYLGTSRIMGITMLLAVVDVFLITVVATLGAFLYNLAAALLGGLEIVFAEEER
ncbi:DUF3566 domain-containing protein [Nocardioides sp. HDW12B]|uniref:DUF3566 domain-containing protein n=1 Tax=Nocardioides sp. HDW12B TaxID=2714939 RepID=UPI00140D7931|nr:DUF3566 domain-containing protein [Nocardioides sp. HDW12B]QIK67912.1 DUF3566 domain-containing protein [Nocardioides sp. HDW12B]